MRSHFCIECLVVAALLLGLLAVSLSYLTRYADSKYPYQVVSVHN